MSKCERVEDTGCSHGQSQSHQSPDYRPAPALPSAHPPQPQPRPIPLFGSTKTPTAFAAARGEDDRSRLPCDGVEKALLASHPCSGEQGTWWGRVEGSWAQGGTRCASRGAATGPPARPAPPSSPAAPKSASPSTSTHRSLPHFSTGNPGAAAFPGARTTTRAASLSEAASFQGVPPTPVNRVPPTKFKKDPTPMPQQVQNSPNIPRSFAFGGYAFQDIVRF